MASDLLKIHGPEIVCRPGCSDCCRNLTVWPVEFYAILEDLRSLGFSSLVFDEKETCGFLKDGLCQIYPFRPLICRTHGLPIAFENDSTQEPQISVSFCPKNFRDWEQKKWTFGPENTLQIDRLNEQLSRIHLQFLEEVQDQTLTVSTRIELKKLLSFE